MKKHKTSSKEVEIPKSKKPKKEIMKYPYSDDDDDDEEEDLIQKPNVSINYIFYFMPKTTPRLGLGNLFILESRYCPLYFSTT